MPETQQETQTREAASAAEAKGQGPPPEEISKAINAAKAAARFQDAADALKREAALVRDPEQRERLWQAAYEKEKEAHGESKKARIMASGWGQGAGLAIGISSAVGMGLGNVVGALLSGVVAIPGVLVGTGVGAIHGPWYKLKDAVSGGGKKAGDNDGAAAEDDEAEARAKAKVLEGDSEAEEDDDDDKAHQAIVDAARKLEADEGTREGGGRADDKIAKEDRPVQEEKVEDKPETPQQPEVKEEKVEDKPGRAAQPEGENGGKNEVSKDTVSG